LIAAQPDCSLQPIDAAWSAAHQNGGVGGPMASCNFNGVGCTETDRIAMVPGMTYPVNWMSSEVYLPALVPFTQLWAILLGR
jgi:hypothetical protein